MDSEVASTAGCLYMLNFVVAVGFSRAKSLLFLQSRSALSTSRCCPSLGSTGVPDLFSGDPVGARGELVPVFGVFRATNSFLMVSIR